MRILIDIGHPGHVHFYKNAIWHLQEQGHEILISARDKDITLTLLREYAFSYRNLSAIGDGRWGLYREFLQRELALIKLIREFDPDIVTEIGGVFIALICKLLGKPSIVFTDTEHVNIDRYLTHPFATVICTPQSFKRELGQNHIRYPGFHELAYLHPKYFQPDPTILQELGVAAGEPFALLRFVSWQALHDVGQEGFPLSMKRQVVQELSHFGKVFITAEGELPGEFESFRITVPANRMHHVIAYAQLYLGEGATMATEAGLLGTPSVYTSSLVGTMGNFDELMTDYGLVQSYRDPAEAVRQAIELMQCKNLKAEWAQRREKLLADKIDVTRFVVDMLEDYRQGQQEQTT